MSTDQEGRANRDRIRNRAGKRKKLEAVVIKLCKEYREGRAASSCMAELEEAIK